MEKFEKPFQKFLRGQQWHRRPAFSVTGSIQGGERPVIIVQNNVGNCHSTTVIVVPCTAEDKPKQPTHVEVTGNKYNTVLCEQVTTCNVSELITYQGTYSEETMDAIDEALSVALGLKPVPNNRQSFVVQNIKVPEVIVPMEVLGEQLKQSSQPQVVQPSKETTTKTPETRTGLDRFKGRYPTINSTPANTSATPEKKLRKWPVEEKIQYIKDYKVLSIDAMRTKWQLESNKKVMDYFYQFRAYLTSKNINVG